MRLVCGLDFDGGSWPGPLAARQASAGVSWTGPAGLLGTLETALGTGGFFRDATERSSVLAARLRSTPGFWSRSAEVDAFGSAQKILSWRDRLAMSGWTGDVTAGRLGAIAVACEGLAPGISDRLRAVLGALQDGVPAIDRIELVDPEASWEPLWIRVFSQLRRVGVSVVAHTPVGSRGTPTVRLLRLPAVLSCAEEVAAFVSGFDPEKLVIIGSDAVLDAALRRFGLASGGAPAANLPATAALLTLVIDSALPPMDAQRALELVTLPGGPVPRDLGRKLARALHEWPAVGSVTWCDVLAREPSEVVDQLFETASGTGRALVLNRLKWLETWAKSRIDDPGMAGLAQACQSLRGVVTTFRTTPTREELQRLVAAAVDTVEAPAPHPREAGPCFLKDPAALVDSAEHVVWWGFTRASASQPADVPLTPIERDAIANAGIDLPDPGARAIARSTASRRPFLFATKSLTLVCPMRDESGDSSAVHPAWDAFQHAPPVTALVEPQIRISRKRRQIPIPAPAFQAVRRDLQRPTESPTSVGTLLGCSAKYVFEKPGGLRGSIGAVLSTLEDPRLRGLIAHHIFEHVFPVGAPPDPDLARHRAGEIFDNDASMLSTQLLMPEFRRVRSELRLKICRAVAELARIMVDSGLQVVGVETDVSAKLSGLNLGGRMDMLAGDPPIIIDLKWGGAWRRDELLAGSSYQLAIYSRLVHEQSGAARWPAFAYFLIDQARWITSSVDHLAGTTLVAGPPPEQVWLATERALHARMDELADGLLQAGGLDAAGQPIVAPQGRTDPGSVENGVLRVPAPCFYCDFGAICGRSYGDF